MQMMLSIIRWVYSNHLEKERTNGCASFGEFIELIYAKFSTIKSEIRFKAAVMRIAKLKASRPRKVSTRFPLKCRATAGATPCKYAAAMMIICVIARASGWLSSRAWKKDSLCKCCSSYSNAHMTIMHERTAHSMPHNDAVHSPLRLL